MSKTLAELAAQFEIREALYRFCRGVDRGIRDEMISAFHPDASDAHGPGGPAVVADALVEKFDGTPGLGQHHITNVLANVMGDVASVESYFVIFNAQDPGRGGSHDLVGGRYLDRFENRGGQWLIAHREIVVDVARSELAGRDILHALPFLIGARRHEDPSAALLGPFSAETTAAQEKVEPSQ